MKALGILIRLLCSLIVLIAVALYLQTGICNISPEQFAATVTPETLQGLFTSLNWVSITAGVLVVLAALRILNLVWNVAFCAATVPVLLCGLYAAFGESVALPSPLQGNACMIEFCTLPQSFPVPALIITGIFALGWLASTAAFRIAITTLVSFGLWYGMSFLLHFVIVTRWADTPAPAQPEILAMVLENPWLIAAVPGAFFLVYAVLVAFFETFLSRRKKPAAKNDKKEEQPADKPAEPKTEPKTAATAAPAKKTPAPSPLANLPKAPLKKVSAKSSADKPAEAKPEAEPKPADKPEETKSDAEPKPADKPAEAKPETEAKPADKPAEAKPETEAKPADKPAEAKPETEAKPADKPEEDKPKA